MKKKYLKILSLFLVFIMMFVTACSTQTTEQPEPKPVEQPTEIVSEEPEEVIDLPYSDDSFSLVSDTGEIIRDNRGAIGTNGVVSTGKSEASLAGLEIIENGGNAIDAAVAAGFALGVTEPQSSGIGGGGFMTLRIAETGETIFIDFREIAPSNASPEMWKLDSDGKVIDNENMIGGKSVGVPGEIAGLLYVLEKYGTMDREEVMAPAIKLAEEGYSVSPTLVDDITGFFANFQKFEEAGNVYLKDGLPPAIGDVIKNPDLANTLKIIAKEGVDGFYKGEIAEKMVKAVTDAGGVLTLEDLANYKVEVSEPVSGTYRGYEILSSPTPSSGGTHIIQILNIFENFDIASMEINSAEYIHLFSEAFKLAFADRSEFMGDPNYVDVPLKGLIDKDYAKVLSEKIDLEKSGEVEFGDPWAYEHEDTTHYSIADKEGNIVGVTKTINGVFASGVMPEGTGFIMNNEMGDFTPGNDSPNKIEPNKKPLSSMSPTIVLKEDKPFMVLGSPGATRIINTVTLMISQVIDHDVELSEAINAPRFYDNTSDKINYENRIDKAEIDKLVEMGHEVSEQEAWSRTFGSVQAVLYEDDGSMIGGADPRRDGRAVGY